VAFLPGTTGRIYQQFSLTIAFSVGLSMFNSLTLTPALSARLLRKTPPQKNAVFRVFDRGLDATRSAYLAVLRWLFRWRSVTLVSYAAMLAAGLWLVRHVPTGFLPAEDDGNFVVAMQGPSGSSLARISRVLDATDKYLHSIPEVEDTFGVGGFSFGGSGPNRAIMFVMLKPWDQRKGKGQSLPEIIERIRGPLMSNPDAMVMPFAPPAIQGVGNFGGFDFEIEDQARRSSCASIASAPSSSTCR
jgi:HAE1 family hydrophobic/amphiphilic exporter-1